MIQGLIVAAIVAFAVWQLVKRFLPKKADATSSDGCGSGCDSCNGCKAIDLGPLEPRDQR